MHIPTSGNTPFPIISIKNLTQTLNSMQIQPTFHLPFSCLAKENIQGFFREDTCSQTYHISWGNIQVLHIWLPPWLLNHKIICISPFHLSCLLLFLISHLSGPNCLVSCLQSLHLTEIAAIVNRSLHLSPFSLTQFDSFTIVTFPPKKTVIQ